MPEYKCKVIAKQADVRPAPNRYNSFIYNKTMNDEFIASARMPDSKRTPNTEWVQIKGTLQYVPVIYNGTPLLSVTEIVEGGGTGVVDVISASATVLLADGSTKVVELVKKV